MSKIHKVIVTGGNGGIGRSIVETFRREGAQVAVIDLAPQEIQCELYHQGDLAQPEAIEAFVEKVRRQFGEVDLLVNNACFSRGGLFTESPDPFESFLEVQKVALAAPYYLTRLLLEDFAQGASIVNVISTRAFMSQADTESYAAAKGGLSSLTHALAISLAGRVRVNGIAPGWIDTTGKVEDPSDLGQHPVKRVGQPEDVAELVWFLASEKAGFINGETILIDGGMSRQMIYHGEGGWTYHGG